MAENTRPGRLKGEERERLTATLVTQYAQGASIRELAAITGRSYGFVHGVLTESGVVLRGRGGATRNRTSRLAAG